MKTKIVKLSEIKKHPVMSLAAEDYIGKPEPKLYTLSDLESVTAITAEFFADRAKADKFYDTHCDALSGIVGVWQYVRDAALILERESKKHGIAGDDYDWLQVVIEFAQGLYEYKSESEIVALADKVVIASKFSR